MAPGATPDYENLSLSMCGSGDPHDSRSGDRRYFGNAIFRADPFATPSYEFRGCVWMTRFKDESQGLEEVAENSAEWGQEQSQQGLETRLILSVHRLALLNSFSEKPNSGRLRIETVPQRLKLGHVIGLIGTDKHVPLQNCVSTQFIRRLFKPRPCYNAPWNDCAPEDGFFLQMEAIEDQGVGGGGS